jgi:hypothetical protein
VGRDGCVLVSGLEFWDYTVYCVADKLPYYKNVHQCKDFGMSVTSFQRISSVHLLATENDVFFSVPGAYKDELLVWVYLRNFILKLGEVQNRCVEKC